MDKFDWFKSEFENGLTSDQQVDIFNRYCDINGYKEHIYPMGDIDEVLDGYLPSEILTLASGGGFDANDEYFAQTNDGLTSFNVVPFFVLDYMYGIYKCREAWEKVIDEGCYFDKIYEEHLDLRPKDMDLDDYYELIEEAVKQYEFESDIEYYLKKHISSNN